MENMQVAAPEYPARFKLGRSRSGAPSPKGAHAANDNTEAAEFAGALALAIPGESVVVNAAEVSASILRAKAMAWRASVAATLAPKQAGRRRLADALWAWCREAAARRTILLFESMPDDRLARAGLRRAELITQIREQFGLAKRTD